MSSSKPTILHVIANLERGGAEQMLLRTLPNLTAFTHQVCTWKGGGPIATLLAQAGVPVVELNARGWWDRAAFSKLVALMRAQRPEIVHAYLTPVVLIARVAARLAGRGIFLSAIRGKHTQPKYWLPLGLEILTTPLVSSYVSNSVVGAKVYRRLGVPAEKMVVISNGIDINNFSSNQTPDLIRKKLGWPTKQLMIGCVGTLKPGKGQEDLLKAVAMLPKNVSPNVIFVGSGGRLAFLNDLAQRLGIAGHVIFLGTRSDVPDLLKAFDIFILPTHHEGMSNAILEAMASGLPIITTDIAENRVLVTHEKEGLLVPSKNPRALSKAICYLAENPTLASRLGRQARRRAMEAFSLSRTIQNLNTLYQKYSTT